MLFSEGDASDASTATGKDADAPPDTSGPGDQADSSTWGTRPGVIFITKAKLQGTLGGIAKANQLCTAYASAQATRPTGGPDISKANFAAYLITNSYHPWRTSEWPDAPMIANPAGWQTTTGAPIPGPETPSLIESDELNYKGRVNVDEDGTSISISSVDPVWMGNETNHCNQWNRSVPGDFPNGRFWGDITVRTTDDCSLMHRLLCVEIP